MARTRIRSFIAVEVPRDTAREIEQFLAKVSKAVQGVRWVKTGGFHLTLQFLGEVEEALIDQIKDRMNDVSSHHRVFHLTPKEIGCFPSPERPRIIWLGFQGDLEALETLQREVAGEDRRFHPHLTLGRVVDPKRASGITDIIYMGRSAFF
ncbi:MAG: RNA 2',3'-cyclic phosphodiesterase, partial [Deltaproteobacteria bacterium]|nr:RNA 2',3'-cyclic phosphodiesterase [Deltaproteobacteria bacterium]